MRISCTSAFHWNRLMKQHVASGSYLDALRLLRNLLRSETLPDHFTFPIALKACSSLSSLQHGRQIHALLLTLDLLYPTPHSANSLIALYSNCGTLPDALRLFEEMRQRNTVTWNSLISGCVRNGLAASALGYFSQMLVSGLLPDSYTVCAVLNAHASLGSSAALRSGRAVHGCVVRRGFQREYVMEAQKRVLLENALVHMYLELNWVVYAEEVFEGMPSRDLITWTTMISGYVKRGLGSLAIAAFRLLVEENVELDPVVLVSVTPAIGFLQLVKEMHGFVVKRGLGDSNAFIAASLLHKYAEFGSIDYAARIFEGIRGRNVVLWTAMIMAHAKHGRSEDSLRLLEEMRREVGVTPNHLTFMGVLTACAHAGLVEKAKECFKCMVDEYKLTPDMHHYAAMADVMGRAGQLKDSMDFIEAMPLEPTPPIWGALLASCGVHQDFEMGHKVAEIVLGMEPENPSNFVLLSNMFAVGQRWDEVGIVRETMRRRGMQKLFGSSSIHVSTMS